MFLLFFAENIGIMRKMRISVNYADPHRRILSDAMVLERKALLVASQFTEQKSDSKTRTKEISLKNTENSKALFY